MIKLNDTDVRVGNYVNAEVGLPSLQTHKLIHLDIVAIAKNQVATYGIPLTEEILLKSGFEKSSNLFFCNINNFSYLKPNAYGCNGNFGYCLSDEKEIYVEVKYLHHLQNLTHALTGEELTVNL